MKLSLGVFFFLTPLFFFSHTVNAATLYMSPNEAELKRGDSITLSVRLDAGEEECINVVDAVISYTENIQPVDISRGQSILSMWVEEPVINKENRTITFAGGIPNGYCGRIPGDPRLTNNIVDLVFQSPGLQIGSTESGDVVSVDFAEATQVLQNDGFGTVAPLQKFGAKINLTKDAGNVVINPWQEAVLSDNAEPEAFSVILERTTNAYSNSYFIVFNTTDKQSGIDHYEVIEEPLNSKNLFGWGAETAPWVEARSPYVLEDQSLNSTIRVRAIDKAGNEYIAVLVPDESKRTLAVETLIIIGLASFVGLLLLGVLAYGVLRWRKKRKASLEKVDVVVAEDEVK
jgi:hypothetical protein